MTYSFSLLEFLNNLKPGYVRVFMEPVFEVAAAEEDATPAIERGKVLLCPYRMGVKGGMVVGLAPVNFLRIEGAGIINADNERVLCGKLLQMIHPVVRGSHRET